MITRLLKILLAASSFPYTVYLFTKAQTGAAIGMIFVTIILTLATLRSMRLVMAFVQLRQQNMDKARVWLSRVSESSLCISSAWILLFPDGKHDYGAEYE